MSTWRCWNCGAPMLPATDKQGKGFYKCPKCNATSVPHIGGVVEEPKPVVKDLSVSKVSKGKK